LNLKRDHRKIKAQARLFFWLPRNLINLMDRQACTGDIVLDKVER
jgi:hypothetical protein